MRIMPLSLLLMLALVTNRSMASSECKLTQAGTEYSGNLSTTTSGYPCERWGLHTITGPTKFPDVSIDEASNYCRNPDPDSFPNGPWCFVNEEIVADYCAVPVCPASPACKMTQAGTEYTGTLSTTTNGNPCNDWADHYEDNAFFPGESLAEASNYCRNPDNDPDGPWCFTTTDGGESYVHEYCDVPFCTASVECGATDAIIRINLNEISSAFNADNLILGDDCTGVKDDTTSILSFTTNLEGCNSTFSYDENSLIYSFAVKSQHDNNIVREEYNLTLSCVYPRSEWVASEQVAPDLVQSDTHIQQHGAFEFKLQLLDLADPETTEYSADSIIPTNKRVGAYIALIAPSRIHMAVQECYAEAVSVTPHLTHTLIRPGDNGSAGCLEDDTSLYAYQADNAYAFTFTMFAFTDAPAAPIVFKCQVNVFEGDKEQGKWTNPEDLCPGIEPAAPAAPAPAAPEDGIALTKRSVRSVGLEVTSAMFYTQQ